MRTVVARAQAPDAAAAEQLRVVLKLSSGAVSSATRMLVRYGIVVRISFPGDRRIYYELHPDAWQRLMRIRLQELAGVPLDASFAEQKRIYSRCNGTFATCNEGADVRRFNRQLIDAGMIKGL